MEKDNSFYMDFSTPFTGGETCVADDTRLDTAEAFFSQNDHSKSYVVAIDADTLGNGDKEHGKALLNCFIKAICKCSHLPEEILVYHRGVLLFENDQPSIEYFRELCDMEIAIKVCGESLERYGLDPALRKVLIVSMQDISQSLLRAERVVRP